MTNERWRAEMLHRGDYSDMREIEADANELVTRANTELDAAEAEKTSLAKERDELAHNLESEREENDRTISALILRAQDAEFRRNDAEGELAARRASDEDVVYLANAARSYEYGETYLASRRLLACDWLKKEGGS